MAEQVKKDEGSAGREGDGGGTVAQWGLWLLGGVAVPL